MEDLTPLGGFVGGLLIGSAVALMLVLNGRVAGISGIVGGLLPVFAFVAAMLAGMALHSRSLGRSG